MDYILIAILGIAWLWLLARVRSLEATRVRRRELASLTQRVYALEHPAAPAPPEALVAPAPAPGAAEPATAAAVAPQMEPPRIAARRREWEALIGGSVLNAVGAIVLVIGIALFLAYSFAHMTAGGRASLAALASLAILGAGVWIEPRPRYRMFARGLIGAGWAALYATSYAIYAIPAAQVIPNAALGSAIQIAVALGMVAHSLRYRSQAVTAVAYSAVFAALGVTPSGPFAVASLVPIAASALYLAARFDWDAMPLAGLAATYVTCAARGESGASLAVSQGLFLAYWLLFEAFDLRRVSLGRIARGAEFLFPLNAIGFLGLSYAAWANHAPDRLWLASAWGAALFLASSIARAAIAPGPAGELRERLRRGTYEASLIVSALLALLAIIGKAPGVWAAAWLAAEAEILFLAGVRFDARFVRGLAMAVFGFSLARLALTTEPGGTAVILGRTFHDWTPAAVFHAALFYWNRALSPRALLYSYGATALAAIALFAETPHDALGFAWVAFGCALFALTFWRKLPDFQAQAFAMLAAGAFAACLWALAMPGAAWWPLAASAGMLYACAFGSARAPEAAGWLSFAASGCAAALVWQTLAHEWAALAWAAIALAYETAGARLAIPQFKWQGPVFAIGSFAAACGLDIDPPRLAISIPAAGLFYAAQFTARRAKEARLAVYYSLLGATLAASILFGRVSGGLLTVAWGLLSLALLGAGFAARERALRLEGLAMLLVCILKLFLYDLRNLETVYRILSFVALGLILLAVSWIYSRFRDQIVRLL